MIDTGSAATAAQQPSPDAINSDPTLIWRCRLDGTLYIADAGCNCLWSWTEADGLQSFNFWEIEDNPVPTGVAVGPDGDIYVSFLSGFPFEPESTRIERWSADGELKTTFDGLTLVTDVLVDADGTFMPLSWPLGWVIVVSTRFWTCYSIDATTGSRCCLMALRQPYGLAQAPDGSLVVSIGASGDLGPKRNGDQR